MQTTQEFITTIIDDYAPDLTVAKALAYLNRAYKAMVNSDCAQNEFLNISDDSFPYPFLQTTDGTLQYEITAANLKSSDATAVTLTVGGVTVAIRKVVRVFSTLKNINNYNNKFRGETMAISAYNQYASGNFTGQFYGEAVGQPYDKTNNQNAKWLFVENPGTTTATYYVQAYFQAPELSAITSAMILDGDKWEMALIDGAVGYWEDVQNGSSERLKRFTEYWLPKYKDANNAGARLWTPDTYPVRECL